MVYEPLFLFCFLPDFQSDLEVDGFYNTEVYNIMCHVMGIDPAPNNGSLSKVCDMLVDGCQNGATILSPSVLLLLVCIVSII
jgi:hypothetical protein